MISLIKGFYKQYFDKPCFKILIIGCEGSGKTTYINAIKLQEG
jgi:GTPase SAR1 family protein